MNNLSDHSLLLKSSDLFTGRWLSRGVVLELHRAATATRLDRNALLSGLDPGYTQGLPTALSSGAQLLMDLDELNRARELQDGILPLRIWLENAAVLLGPRDEGALIRSALEQIRLRAQAGI